MIGLDATSEWINLLYKVYNTGKLISPRKILTREILNCTSVIDMKKPIITCDKRKLGYKFMPAEAAWILNGDNRVKTILPYSKEIIAFADDNYFYRGAYGPKIIDQLSYVVECLANDFYTRQAVINIWRETPRQSKDIPCTITIQYLIRDGKLHSFVHMRSSDVWLGVPYDWFNQCMLAGYVLLLLNNLYDTPKVELGNLYFTAASQHLYEKNATAAKNILENGYEEAFNYKDFNPYEFKEPNYLIDHLWAIANKDISKIITTFMTEVFNGK